MTDKKEKKGLMGMADPDSMMGKMMGSMGEDFLMGIVSKIQPFISPMIQSISEEFGDDEIMCILRKNNKDGRMYVHVIETAGVKAFSLEEGALRHVIDGEDFIQKVLSGGLGDIFNKDKSEE